jgi:hypothetical protein
VAGLIVNLAAALMMAVRLRSGSRS